LLPLSVKEVLGEDHLVFFVHGVVEQLDLEEFVRTYGEEGGALYAPELMLKVWLYAFRNLSRLQAADLIVIAIKLDGRTIVIPDLVALEAEVKNEE
jgi:hypothetical protein